MGHQAKDHGNNDDDKRFPCQFCERVFKFPAQLSQHERIHTKEKPFKCEICTKKFSAKCNLKSHMEIHKDLEERRFRCSLVRITLYFIVKCSIGNFKMSNLSRGRYLDSRKDMEKSLKSKCGEISKIKIFNPNLCI